MADPSSGEALGRRRETAALTEHGKRAGRIRDDLDTQPVIDLLFGSVIFRLFDGPGPLGARAARAAFAAGAAA